MNYTDTYIQDLIKVHQVCPNLIKLKKTSVLITGATGLICSAIVDFLLCCNDILKTDVKVYVASRNKERAETRFSERFYRKDVIFVNYDALKSFDLESRVDYIIHGAGLANPKMYAEEPVETMLSNLIGTNSILEYAKEKKCKRVLFISSSEVYGKKNNSNPYSDSEYGYVDILLPRSCYPSAKRACETLCISYKEKYGIDCVIVRPGHIYGPTASRSDKRASSQFFYDVLDGHDIIMKSSGEQIRSYCYVIDCVSAIISVLLNGEIGKAYNISNPYSVMSIRELAELIASVASSSVIFEKPTNVECKGYNMMENSSLDASSLLTIGWRPSFNKLEGIEHTYCIMKGVK